MYTFGNFDLSLHNFGYFRLDGGAMFGAVPKNIWSKRVPADEENCIRLATRSLLIRDEKRSFLIDVGLGEKWSEKSRQIFAIKNFSFDEIKINPEEITDIILTHLHFDHGGGISHFKGTELRLTYPNARVYVQEDNFKNASSPNVRERASYLKENVEILNQAHLQLLKGSTEIYPGIWVHQANGHTRGQQWIELRQTERSLVYPTDLVPTSHHLPVPYNMGYNICTETILREKEEFLSKAYTRDSIIIFQHDPEVAAASITKDEKGHYCIKNELTFS